MEQALTEAISQVPALGVLAFIVWIFLQNNRALTDAIRNNTDATNNLGNLISQFMTNKPTRKK